MKCVICNQAGTIHGTTSVVFERDPLHLVIHNVPADICQNCGETYADETVTGTLLWEAEKMARAGAKVEVREYKSTGN